MSAASASREKLRSGCRPWTAVPPKQTSFCQTRPAAGLQTLRTAALVRYFNLPRISEYLRITIGNEEDMAAFCATCRELFSAGE